jgi:hypothetical protein
MILIENISGSVTTFKCQYFLPAFNRFELATYWTLSSTIFVNKLIFCRTQLHAIIQKYIIKFYFLNYSKFGTKMLKIIINMKSYSTASLFFLMKLHLCFSFLTIRVTTTNSQSSAFE